MSGTKAGPRALSPGRRQTVRRAGRGLGPGGRAPCSRGPCQGVRSAGWGQGAGRVRLCLGPKLQGVGTLSRWLPGEVAGASADAATAQAQAPVTGASGGQPPQVLLHPRSPVVASARASWQPLPAPCPPGPRSTTYPGQLPQLLPSLPAPVPSAARWEAPLRLAPQRPQEPCRSDAGPRVRRRGAQRPSSAPALRPSRAARGGPRRACAVSQMKGALTEIIQLASLDSDPWVLMVADILKSFPDSGALNLDLEEQNPNVQDILGELREKGRAGVWSAGEGGLP